MQGYSNNCVFGVRPDRRAREMLAGRAPRDPAARAGEARLAEAMRHGLIPVGMAEVISATPIGFNGENTLYQLNRGYCHQSNRFFPGEPFWWDFEGHLDSEGEVVSQSASIDPFWVEAPGGVNEWTRPKAPDTELVTQVTDLLSSAPKGEITAPAFVGGFNLAHLASLVLNEAACFEHARQRLALVGAGGGDYAISLDTNDGVDWGAMLALPAEHLEMALQEKGSSLIRQQLAREVAKIAMLELQGDNESPRTSYVPLHLLSSVECLHGLYVAQQELEVYTLDADPGEYWSVTEAMYYCPPEERPLLQARLALAGHYPGVIGWQWYNGRGRQKSNAAALRSSRAVRTFQRKFRAPAAREHAAPVRGGLDA